ncbi:MAG: MotA/TolQ/ExbB proton channel family protein [Candidatus Saganbacteria bacterium]|nr:MotA/TolQ/ExbB proton channel family protein [Candidatus Saganbacteria bacterium]
MDFVTILGFILGATVIYFGVSSTGVSTVFLNLPSFLIVFGGTVASAMIGTPHQQLFTAVRAGGALIFSHKNHSQKDAVSLITRLSKKSIQNGIFSLQGEAKKSKDSFLSKAVRLVVSGMDQESIRKMLEKEVIEMRSRHRETANIFRTMGMYAPMFGLLGTILGIIQLLRNLSDPAAIGPSMALAIVTTFYGILLANLVFIPLSSKLRIKSQEEVLYKEMIIEGMLGIQAGEMPYNILCPL